MRLLLTSTGLDSPNVSEDFTELDLVDVVVSPHYVEEEKEIVDEFAAKSGLKVLPLRYGEALVVDGEGKNVIR